MTNSLDMTSVQKLGGRLGRQSGSSLGATATRTSSVDAVSANLLSAWRACSTPETGATALNAPEGLLPPLRTFGGRQGRIIPVTSDTGRNVVGIVGVHRFAPLFGLTGALPALWSSEFGPLGSPVLAPSQAEAFLSALFDQNAVSTLFLPHQYLDSAQWLAIDAAARERGYFVAIADQWHRASLRPRQGAGFVSPLSRRHKKEHRRLFRRLQELGEVRFAVARDAAALSRARANFFALEASGWKGAAKTALVSTRERRDYVDAFLTGFEQQGGVVIDELLLDDKPIASLITLSADSHAVTWKIAFDQDFARFSPGTLLMNEVTARFLREAQFDLVDSLATPNHPMIDRLWSDRVHVGHALIAKSPMVGRLRVAELKAKQSTKTFLKQLIKRRVSR